MCEWCMLTKTNNNHNIKTNNHHTKTNNHNHDKTNNNDNSGMLKLHN